MLRAGPFSDERIIRPFYFDLSNRGVAGDAELGCMAGAIEAMVVSGRRSLIQPPVARVRNPHLAKPK